MITPIIPLLPEATRSASWITRLYGLDLGILVRTAAVCGPRGSCRVEALRRAVTEVAG
jgi:hypothetical protein